MSDEQKIARTPAAPMSHRVLYLVAAVAQGGGPLLTQPFVQRLLDPVQWGLVSFSISTISIGLIVFLAGLPLIITRTYFEPKTGRTYALSLAGFGIIFSTSLGALIALVLWIVSAAKGSTEEMLSLIFACLSVGMLGGIQMCLAVLRAQQRAIAFVALTIGAQTLGHVAGLFAVIFVARNASAYLIAFTVVIAITLCASMILTRPRSPFSIPGVIVQRVKAALPLLPHSIALVCMLQGEAFVLTSMHGPAFWGTYGAMLPLALGPVAMLLALANVWEPAILAARGTDPDGKIGRIQREALAIGALLAIMASVSAVFLANILAHDPSHLQTQAARILPLTTIGYAVFLLATTQLVATGRTALMAMVTPIVMVASVAGTIAASTAGSIFLVAIAKVSGFVVLGIVYTMIARKQDKSLVLPREVAIALLGSVLCVTLMLLVPTSFWLGAFMFAGLFLLTLIGGSWLLLRKKKTA